MKAQLASIVPFALPPALLAVTATLALWSVGVPLGTISFAPTTEEGEHGRTAGAPEPPRDASAPM